MSTALLQRYDLTDGPDAGGTKLLGIRAGAEWEITFRLKLSGVPEPLAGKAFAFVIRQSRASEEVLLDATSTNGLIVLEEQGLVGALSVRLSAAATLSLPDGRAFYSLAETAPRMLARLEGDIDVVRAGVR